MSKLLGETLWSRFKPRYTQSRS